MNRKKQHLFLFIVMSIFTAKTTLAATLSDLWDAVELYSAEYAATNHNRDAILEQEQQAKAAFRPQISAHSSWQRQPESLSNSEQTMGWQIQLNQSIFDASKRAQYRQSKHNSEAAQYRLQQEQETLLLKVSETYFNYLLATDTINTAQQEKQAYQQQLKQAKELFKRGAATALDINEAQAGYDQAFAKEAVAITQQHIHANQLASDTGILATEIETIPTTNLVKNYLPIIRQYDLTEWQNLALQRNYEYQSQKELVASYYEALNAVKNKRLPVVSGNLAYQNNLYAYHNDFKQKSKGMSIGVSINIPLYTGGEYRSQVRENSAKYYEAEQQLLAIERKVKLAVQQAYMKSMTSIQEINAQKRLLESSQKKLIATKTGRNYGFRNQLEVLQARQEVATVEQQLSQANYQFLNSYLTLIKESGLGLKQTWKQPE